MRVNIPAAITSVWVTNPITWPVILFWQYRLGAFLLDEGGGVGGGVDKALALLLGCGITGVVAGFAGWLGAQLIWLGVARWKNRGGER